MALLELSIGDRKRFAGAHREIIRRARGFFNFADFSFARGERVCRGLALSFELFHADREGIELRLQRFWAASARSRLRWPLRRGVSPALFDPRGGALQASRPALQRPVQEPSRRAMAC